jgi:hypothetical protein
MQDDASFIEQRQQLTLPRLKHGGFFLHPARLPDLALPERVEALCPEAFRPL